MRPEGSPGPGRREVPPLVDLPLNQAEEPPFLRPARRTRVRRRGPLGRTLLALQSAVVAAAAVAAMGAAYARVMGSERLKVARVDVRGTRFLSEGEVRELLGPAVGENILRLDIEGLKARLRASPWVARAAVVRTLPDTLRVEIDERVPLALAELDRLYLVDAEGALIEIYGPRTSGFDLPIVRGLLGVDAETRRGRTRAAGELLADLGELSAEVSEVEVEPSGDLRVVLRGAGEVVRLGAPPWRGRFLTFLGLRAQLAARCPGAEWFDLRFRDRIYAKECPAPAGAEPEGSARRAAAEPGPDPGAGAEGTAGGEPLPAW